MNPLKERRIILGVTGSIAAYKAVELASKMTQVGAEVDVILTSAAAQFVKPLSFQSVTGRRAGIDDDLWGAEGHISHIALAKGADLIVIAPASANTLAKLANGLADNLLTLTALAASCPLLLAPAMDAGMFDHPATQENVKSLSERGAIILGPQEGHLASGLVGKGRMVEPADLLAQIRFLLSRKGPLIGKKIVVTAGGTQELIDPVRMITNRSSGKQGYALAQAALDLGAEVTLISGPVSLDVPVGADYIGVRTAQEMLEAVLKATPHASALVMAAAVADFRPDFVSASKIKKEKGLDVIQLEKTADILMEVATMKKTTGWPKLTIGFAAESDQLIANAKLKLASKQLDLIVANDISAEDAGFSVDTNRVTFLFPDGSIETPPLMSKVEVAETIMQKILMLIG